MMIHEVTAIAGKYKKRKRVGRGVGSGNGKTAGRGQKGAASRSGHSTRFQFEGGQMPFFRRMPKFGFSNYKFRTEFWAVNLGKIVAHDDFKKGGTVNAETLAKAGIIRDASRDLKILGGLSEGDTALKVKLEITANRVSGAARKLVEDAGGKVTETGSRRDRVRGIDRNSDDQTPKNLTKKLKKQAWHKARSEAFARGEVIKKN
jgi:large subunit ribosomal protein L15|tara:strand:- start:3048 stop:3659 length:612 start_codon:yes stop_codon:yes gene_type:complete